MAKLKLPDPLKRRHLVAEELPEKRAQALAEAYLAEGRSLEALDFLAQVGAREGLESVRDEAVAVGDVFLLREAARHLGEEPDAATWLRLGDAAEAAGKESYAAEARRIAAARD